MPGNLRQINESDFKMILFKSFNTQWQGNYYLQGKNPATETAEEIVNFMAMQKIRQDTVKTERKANRYQGAKGG